MKALFGTLLVLGYIAMILAVVCGVGYGLYLFGVVELTIGKAAWTGFLLWVKMFFGGILACVVGYVGVLSK